MSVSSFNAAADRASPARDSLTAAARDLRRASGNCLRGSAAPAACDRLRAILVSRIVEPLWQRADAETDPVLAMLRVALAELAQQYVQLLTAPNIPADQPQGTDPLARRAKILAAIRQLKKELQDDDFDGLL
jgi:hypothetical protein